MSLMAKSVTVVIPAVLLALDWYPLQRFRKDNIRTVMSEKIPFFVVSAIMAAATIFFIDKATFLVTSQNFPFMQRVVVSGNALFEYCRLLLYPLGIIPYYRIPDPIPVGYAVKTVIFAVLAAFCLVTAGKKSGRAVVLLCFVLLLLPVLAFFQNGDQSYAARFTYLPAVAPSIAVAFGLATLLNRWGSASRSWRFALPVLVGLLLIYGGITQKQIAVWDSSETMWSRVVDVDPSAIAYKERGWLFLSMGKYAAAVEDFTKALADPLPVWRPYIYNLYAFRGEALSRAGRYDEAVQDLTTAIEMLPHPVYYRLRGAAFQGSGKTAEAEADFSRAGGELAPLDWYWSKVE
jgi:tetratricopeptide (TPR) repeat protein